MAFPEDSDYSTSRVQSSQGSSIMQLQSSTLLAVILQIGLGILTIMYALPAAISMILLASLFGFNPLTDIATFGYLIAWVTLPIAGAFQIRAGYRFYKRKPDTLNFAKQVDIVAIILFGMDTIISAFENLLIHYPQVALYLAANILLLVLLNMQSIGDELEPKYDAMSTYQFYNE